MVQICLVNYCVGTKLNLCLQHMHTHYTRERHLADKNWMIHGMHVDSVSNLAVLCERCHRMVHENDFLLQLLKANCRLARQKEICEIKVIRTACVTLLFSIKLNILSDTAKL